MKNLLIPLFCLSIVSCETDDETRQRRKHANTDSLVNPIEITLPDGKVVKRIEFRNPDNIRESTQYIYMIGDVTTMNTTHREGKVEVSDVTVLINGKKYVPAEKE
jgi:hypothetical protein